MAKKKKNHKKEGVVYSTDPDYEFELEEEIEEETLPPEKQNLRIILDRLKGNKKVTRIYQYVGTTKDLNDLAKSLKQLCGCGGGVKNGEILLQGDFREKVKKEFDRLRYRYKQVGG